MEQDDNIFSQPIYGLTKQQKDDVFLERMTTLHRHHMENCAEYANIVRGTQFNLNTNESFRDIESIPYVHVRLFKNYLLRSTPPDKVIKTITSSGTTGANVSRISLDQSTSAAQTKALVYILQSFLGRQRLPMLIIDHPSVIRDRKSFSARGAGILGLSNFGRNHTYALNDDMSLNYTEVEKFINRFGDQRVLIFGFTFMIWEYLVEQLQPGFSLRLPNSIVFHSGGWKKLLDRAVTNQAFHARLGEIFQSKTIHNFYGMAEQVGSIFVECEKGFLHPPIFADVVIRNPMDFSPQPAGLAGIIQVLSLLPTSYPGHSILTEDLGTVHGTDDCECGRRGNYFTVAGRIAKAEARGCSDTFVKV